LEILEGLAADPEILRLSPGLEARVQAFRELREANLDSPGTGDSPVEDGSPAELSPPSEKAVRFHAHSTLRVVEVDSDQPEVDFDQPAGGNTGAHQSKGKEKMDSTEKGSRASGSGKGDIGQSSSGGSQSGEEPTPEDDLDETDSEGSEDDRAVVISAAEADGDTSPDVIERMVHEYPGLVADAMRSLGFTVVFPDHQPCKNEEAPHDFYVDPSCRGSASSDQNWEHHSTKLCGDTAQMLHNTAVYIGLDPRCKSNLVHSLMCLLQRLLYQIHGTDRHSTVSRTDPSMLFPLYQGNGFIGGTTGESAEQGLSKRCWRYTYLDRIPGPLENEGDLGPPEGRQSISSFDMLSKASLVHLGLEQVSYVSFKPSIVINSLGTA
jgi:hypothetical protein